MGTPTRPTAGPATHGKPASTVAPTCPRDIRTPPPPTLHFPCALSLNSGWGHGGRGMDTRVAWRALCAAAALFIGLAQAAEPSPGLPDDRAQRSIDQVEGASDLAYRDALAAFDTAARRAPDDVDIALARCKFLQYFADDELGSFKPEAVEASRACAQQLHEHWPDAPKVQLFELDQLWGADAAERGEALIKSADQWPAPLRRDLLSKTSVAQEGADDARAGELALMAVRQGDASRVAAAVTYLSGQKHFKEAADLLAKAEPAELPWDAQQRIEAALTLPDTKIAVVEARRHTDALPTFGAEASARAYLRAGDFASARRVLKDVRSTSENITAVKFDAAIGIGDFAGAAVYVDITDTENLFANVGRFLTLAVAAPTTLVKPSMLLALAICLAYLAAMALVPGLVLVPAHYRGLARRLKGKVSEPLFPAIGIKRAWYGAAVALIVPMAVVMLVQPEAMAGMAEGNLMASDQMFRAFLFAEIAALVCVAPALIGMTRRQFLGDRTALRTWWVVLLMWGALIAIGWVLTFVQTRLGVNLETTQTRMVAAMVEGGAQLGGPMLSLLILALVGPVFEEFVFRGLLLGGLSRHISFGWANTLQALGFAAMHDDPPRFLYYFAMGLFGGWLVKRTGSLAPTIALHVLNNAVAVGVLLWVG
ncbi:CPBP family intramembrane metalloprotease [Lysobacter soli]|uniref:CPBP family intramembrane glutamic endopeptidase n=1 Tax=Lysobacter soli TaxID=453783 RepID=UPI00209FA3F3|nr:type II CAAX endopeptidase family protein [Lysobacter soli]UTA53522.1 CPBP family intramembrane metalloprotease [Lysobacter soli]